MVSKESGTVDMDLIRAIWNAAYEKGVQEGANAAKGLDEFDAAMADCNEGRVVDMETAMTEAPPCDGHELSVNVTIWYGYCPECLKRGENGTSDGKRQGVY